MTRYPVGCPECGVYISDGECDTCQMWREAMRITGGRIMSDIERIWWHFPVIGCKEEANPILLSSDRSNYVPKCVTHLVKMVRT
jgi:hypothetical protein